MGHGDTKLGHLLFQRCQPGGIWPRLGQETIAAAHRLCEIRGPTAMLGIERQHEPVEKPAPVGGGAGEQAIHRGRQPDHAQMIQKLVHGSGGRAVEAKPARLPLLAAFRAGTDIHLARHAVERGKNRKATRASGAGDIAIGGAAQAAAGRQERHRFHEVRFARTILSCQHDMPAVERQR